MQGVWEKIEWDNELSQGKIGKAEGKLRIDGGKTRGRGVGSEDSKEKVPEHRLN